MYWIVVILLAILGLLVLAFLAMWVIGRRLPLDHVTAAEVDIDLARDAVWDTIADVASYPAWSRIDRVERLPDADGQDVWRQHFGRNSVVTRTSVRERPGRYQQTIDDDKKFFSGTWTYEIKERTGASGQAACTVRLTEHGRVHPAIPRFFMAYLVDPAMYLKQQLRSLGQRFGGEASVREVQVKP